MTRPKCEFVPTPLDLHRSVRWVITIAAMQAVVLAAGVWTLSRGLRVSGMGHEALTGAMLILTGMLGAAASLVSACRLAGSVRRYHAHVASLNLNLAREFGSRMSHTLATRDALIFGLAKLADRRDAETGAHLDRICSYSVILARGLRRVFPEISEEWIEHLRVAASLHDIGKVGIPDAVLLKRGAHTPDERRRMCQHPVIGADTLLAIRRRLGDDALVNMAIQVTLEHHERWDGAGYPLGLRGEQIAPAARIVALADVYDALTSERVYKKVVPHGEARAIILDGAGTQFDPEVAHAFDRVHAEFDQVRRALLPVPAPEAIESLAA